MNRRNWTLENNIENDVQLVLKALVEENFWQNACTFCDWRLVLFPHFFTEAATTAPVTTEVVTGEFSNLSDCSSDKSVRP